MSASEPEQAKLAHGELDHEPKIHDVIYWKQVGAKPRSPIVIKKLRLCEESVKVVPFPTKLFIML